jgi:phytoene dehydrogenase-like protein
MLYRMAGESKGNHAIPAGGVNGLVESLCASATKSGVDIRNGALVRRVLIDGSADGLVATGVQLADGEKIEASHVISATDPQRTFLELVGVEHLNIGFTNRIRRLRCDGYVAKLHLALSELPEFDGLEHTDGRMIIAPELDALEFAFDDAKYGELPTRPVMEIVIPSVHDTSLAPPGQHLLSAHVMYVPYRLKGGWTDEAREQICERAIDTIAQYAPRIREQIIHREFLTPFDLEQDFRVTGGHWHHIELAMDQMLMMRPTYEAAQYGTPIPGLFLCGAGCHPGGGIMGAAGHNAAREVLR